VVGPSEELFRFHTALVSELGGCLCGRRLYETMLVWETDPSLRENELEAAFADVWCALPKVVFSRTLESVQGNARLAEASLAEEIAAAQDATDKDEMTGRLSTSTRVPADPRHDLGRGGHTHRCTCRLAPDTGGIEVEPTHRSMRRAYAKPASRRSFWAISAISSGA
jgi:hypothetical protein